MEKKTEKVEEDTTFSSGFTLGNTELSEVFGVRVSSKAPSEPLRDLVFTVHDKKENDTTFSVFVKVLDRETEYEAYYQTADTEGRISYSY